MGQGNGRMGELMADEREFRRMVISNDTIIVDSRRSARQHMVFRQTMEVALISNAMVMQNEDPLPRPAIECDLPDSVLHVTISMPSLLAFQEMMPWENLRDRVW